MGRIKDISGQRFGKLLALEVAGKDAYRHTIWKCICDCGNETYPLSTSLLKEKTKSCGCEEAVIFSSSKKEHRRKLKSAHPLYSIFGGMKNRCYCKSDINYRNYGGRGISVCREWLDDPSKFVLWASTNGWQKGLKTDRIDNDGNYEPGNIRFVTNKENCNNTRKNRTFNLNGTKLKWEEIEWMCRVTKNSFMHRIYRGWNTMDALILSPQAPNSLISRYRRKKWGRQLA